MMGIREIAGRLLEGSTVLSDSGTRLYTPDGKGNYRALWTRDFAYMLRGAGELIPPEDARACVEYLMAGAREEDGWIPDRVEPDGFARYTAGMDGFPALPNLDNGPFLVQAAEAYLERLPKEEADKQFARWAETLRRGVDCLPRDENGLIVNDTTPPHSPYGFTDCVAKTGKLAMETLLYWEALGILAARGAERERYEGLRAKIEAAFAETFLDGESGMLLSATGACRQIDVWASCYALRVGFPLPPGAAERISDWLAEHYRDVVEGGQLRHLPKGEYWERLFVEVKPGEYQNGAFWATPVEWLCAALRARHRDLAERTLDDLLAYFEEHGVFECVNGELRRLDTYVVSATNAMAAAKAMGRA